MTCDSASTGALRRDLPRRLPGNRPTSARTAIRGGRTARRRGWPASGGRRAASRPLARDASWHVPSEPSQDRKSTRLNSSHLGISYAVFCLKKNKKKRQNE